MGCVISEGWLWLALSSSSLRIATLPFFAPVRIHAALTLEHTQAYLPITPSPHSLPTRSHSHPNPNQTAGPLWPSLARLDTNPCGVFASAQDYLLPCHWCEAHAIRNGKPSRLISSITQRRAWRGRGEGSLIGGCLRSLSTRLH